MIHLGDVFIHTPDGWDAIRKNWKFKMMLVRGNHDKRSVPWWLDHGFGSVVDSCIIRGVYFTHKPSEILPPGANLNVHGHLHNIWNGFKANGDKDFADEATTISRAGCLKYPWQRLFAVEYTNYMPIEFDKFISHPDRYQARGPNHDE